MKVIHKYRLELTDEQTIEMPKDAKVIHADSQAGHLCVWAEFEATSRMAPRSFRVIPTGAPFDAWGLIFIRTVLIPEQFFVAHVYEVMS